MFFAVGNTADKPAALETNGRVVIAVPFYLKIHQHRSIISA
jgi:hypothetical protein